MTARTDVSVSVNGKRVTGTAGTLNHTTRVGVCRPQDRKGKGRSRPPEHCLTTIGRARERVKIERRTMPPKTVAVVSAVSLMIGWLLASTLSPPIARLQSLPERPASTGPAAAAVATPYTEALALKQRAAPPPPQPRRNPFVFGEREPRPSSQPRRVNTETLPPPHPVRPPYELSGIGIS